ncbi:EamA family transporter RarD [Enemella evansiae]|uniref:Protein RarD n=1 Tax=Enemella evansiae TaxID=2016499 RepID=A0A255GBI4_9ACTN|nr:EamA family transporter RarD [Enemella evansiae]OYO09270.1 protein RarD [Enemella evansiae]OYO13259.1 protein RarD [Enemella evansiae]TDO90027.1 chloramphenicol-sensitive protein RarD [Enemella evansiae]
MTSTPPETGSRAGVTAALTAYALWGLVPLYWRLIDGAGAFEVLAHRIIWSLAFGVLLVLLFARTRWRRQLASPRTLLTLAAAAGFVTINWGVYIWAVTNDRVTETALGYYINPLISILFGVLLLQERLAPIQWVAIGLAAIAVVVITIGYGRLPWVALLLAGSFGIYGVIKKRVTVEPIVSLTYESAVATLPALLFLGWLAARGGSHFGQQPLSQDLLLMGGGVVTAVPLLAFAFAAQRIPLSLLGITQYLAPTIQFVLGVAVFGEPMPPARWAGFMLVWLALMLITGHALWRARRRRTSSLGGTPAG